MTETPPTDDPAAPGDDLRAALLDQLAYLIEEAEATRSVVGAVPEAVQTGRALPDDRTMRETYGLLAALDRQVHAPRMRTLAAATGAPPAFDHADPDALVAAHAWNEVAMDALLDDVQAARRTLLDALRAVDDWSRTLTVGSEPLDVFTYAHRVAEADFRLLRTLSLRLHDANLGA
jgi:hypothetical protein